MSDVTPYRPRWFEDVPWRVGYRFKRFVFHIFGPPQLTGRNDPHVRLAAERAERYAGRRRRGGS